MLNVIMQVTNTCKKRSKTEHIYHHYGNATSVTGIPCVFPTCTVLANLLSFMYARIVGEKSSCKQHSFNLFLNYCCCYY